MSYRIGTTGPAIGSPLLNVRVALRADPATTGWFWHTDRRSVNFVVKQLFFVSNGNFIPLKILPLLGLELWSVTVSALLPTVPAGRVIERPSAVTETPSFCFHDSVSEPRVEGDVETTTVGEDPSIHIFARSSLFGVQKLTNFS